MRRARVLAAIAGLVVVPLIGGFAGTPTPAYAGCPDPDYPCDPPPPKPLPNPVYLEWGCGTVTVHATKYEVGPLHILPCPGPVIW